jgi:nucleotide-binding universal stress UspA family protein
MLEVSLCVQLDFIVLGIAGQDNRDIGSVTENVMQEARCTTFAIKHPCNV